MNVKTYNQIGKEVGQTRLPKEVFDLKISPDLVHQVVVCQLANRRQGTSHTKDRSEVRGGGRKPWRQKGTGRARHGSIRSPLWRGGGITFGPRKEKKIKKLIPKQMKRKALLMVLSGKAENNLLILLDKLQVEKGKTREIFELLKKLPCKTESALIALPDIDKKLILAARNIPQVETMQVKDLNALDLLTFKYLIMPKENIRIIKETFMK